MPAPKFQKEILEQLGKLTVEQQLKVLDFARELVANGPVGAPGRDLLRFAGAIDPEDLKTMAQVIEEESERVNLNEW
jgi:hypothetical protein